MLPIRKKENLSTGLHIWVRVLVRLGDTMYGDQLINDQYAEHVLYYM